VKEDNKTETVGAILKEDSGKKTMEMVLA